jgi:uncharacterized protein DUF1203
MNIQIAPLPQTFLDRVRTIGLDDQQQPVRRLVAEGGEPCRDVLRRARPGEELILASFSPFAHAGPFREFGPVFLLANPSSEDVVRTEFPTNGYFNEQLTIRAYDAAESIADATLTTAADAPRVIEEFLGRDGVQFVHARFPAYGCFACRIDRV